jgi:predicted permease
MTTNLMNPLKTVWRWLRSLAQRRAAKQEIDEELRFHIEQRTAENIAAGMSPEEAEREARKRFGNLQSVREECREKRGIVWMDGLVQDARFFARTLRKHPLSNAVVVLTIALLIVGVSVIYASFLGVREKLLPFPEPDRFVKLWRSGEKSVTDSFPGDLHAEFSKSLTSLEGIGALDSSEPKTLTDVGEARSYDVFTVSVNLLKLAGIPPLKGRLFDEADLEAESDSPIIISEQMWREKLEADENIIGRRLRLSDELHLVVGVMPAPMRTTRLAWNADIWILQRFGPEVRNQSLLFGRLKPGISLEQAQAETRAVAAALEQARSPGDAEDGYRSSTLAPIGKNLRERSDRISVEMLLAVLFATVIVACVVGIACFNVTNLLLARVTVRARELAVRVAIGAGRLRIVRLLLMESVLLAVLGGLAGLLLSAWLIYAMRVKGLTVQGLTLRFDPQLFLLAAGGALLLGVLVGLLPSVRSSRADLTEALKDGGQSTGGRKRHRLRNFLVSSEIAMAVVLCVAAGLLTRAYFQLTAGDLGFDPDKSLIVRVNFRGDRYSETRDRLNYLERAKQALEEIPGVSSVAVATSVGLMNSRHVDEVRVEATGDSEAIQTRSEVEYGSRELPALKGMNLVRGRGLSPDAASAANEALVNEFFVREHLAGREPIGVQLRVGRDESSEFRRLPDGSRKLLQEQPPKWRTIVGVVRDRHPLASGSEGEDGVILDYRDAAGWWGQHVDALYMQTAANAKVMPQPIREALQRLDALQPVEQPLFLADLIEQRTSFRRSAIKLLGGLGGVGLLMALMGVYGVVAFSVQERTREVGIRMAVGASRSDILKLMLWQGARLTALGGVPGLLIGTSASAGLLGVFENGSSAFDLVTCAIVIVVVGAGGFLASFFPARKAAQLNPMTALRYE